MNGADGGILLQREGLGSEARFGGQRWLGFRHDPSLGSLDGALHGRVAETGRVKNRTCLSTANSKFPLMKTHFILRTEKASRLCCHKEDGNGLVCLDFLKCITLLQKQRETNQSF